MAEVQGITPPPGNASMKPEDERMYGMLCHLLGFAGSLGIPLGGFIGPLVVWLIKKDQSAFVDKCGKDSLNFQISITIWMAVCIPFVLLFFLGAIGIFALWLVWVISIIQASVAANQGRHYVYPLTITFFR